MQTVVEIQYVFFIAFGILASRMVRQGRRDPAAAYLEPRQRIRPLTLEYLDPLLTIIVVGPLLVRCIYLEPFNILCGFVGFGIGIPVGLLRSRVQYVRAIKNSKSIVLRRSAAEYALVVVLVIIRSVENSFDKSSSNALLAIAAVLLGFPLGESIFRSRSMIEKYHAETDGKSPGAPSPSPDQNPL